MKKRCVFLIVIFFSIFFTGCEYFGPGCADYSYKLSPNYKLVHAVNNSINSLDNGYVKEIIVDDVIGIAWNKEYILASSKNKDSLNYWILPSNKIEPMGPFTIDEFNKKRDELKIDSSLKLEDPEKYRYLEKEQSSKK